MFLHLPAYPNTYINTPSLTHPPNRLFSSPLTPPPEPTYRPPSSLGPLPSHSRTTLAKYSPPSPPVLSPPSAPPRSALRTFPFRAIANTLPASRRTPHYGSFLRARAQNGQC